MSNLIRGPVVEGNRMGHKLGFPTINLSYEGDQSGVYVGRIFLGTQFWPAAVNVGGRPTVDDKILCEIHVIEWNGKVEEGEAVEVELLHKIRDVQKFKDLEMLKKQIARDVEFAKNWYNRFCN